MSPGWPVAPAAVALDLLDDRERALADRLLADDPLFRAEVERLRATAGALAQLDRDAWRPPAPPPLPDAPLPAPPAAVPVRRPRRRFALAAASALTLALALLIAGDRRDRGATTLTLRPLAGVPGHATLTISGAQAELRGAGMPASGAHDYYEAWLGDARGRTSRWANSASRATGGSTRGWPSRSTCAAIASSTSRSSATTATRRTRRPP